MEKDREYYLKRAREEQAKAETTVDGGARRAHGKMAELYAERAGARAKAPAVTPPNGKLFVVRE